MKPHRASTRSRVLAATAATDVISLLRVRAEHQAGRTAYVFLENGEREEASLSFADLERGAAALAAHIAQCLTPGSRALLLYPPGLEYIQAFFACLYTGTVAVPAYPPTRHHVHRLTSIVGDAQPSLVLTTQELKQKLSGSAAERADWPELEWLATDTLDTSKPARWAPPAIDPGRLAFLQYTSGSTGDPKGVMVSHANLMANQCAIAACFQHTETSNVVGWLPLYHDMGLIGNVLQPLYLGSTAVLMSPMAFLEQPWRWLAAISRYRAHTSGGPNFAYELCVRKVSAAQKHDLDLSCWQVAFNGAEPVRAATLERFYQAFKSCGFRREAWLPCYGLAEASLLVTGSKRGHAPRQLTDAELTQAIVTEASPKTWVACGQTSVDHQIYIVNPDTQRVCSEGEVGEVWVGGPSVAQGYWNRPEETTEIFKAALAGEPEQRYLRTGDLGFLHQCQLYLTGRRKDLIILRGRNYYPQDLEAALDECASVLRPGGNAAFSVTENDEEILIVAAEVQRDALREQGADVILQVMREALAQMCDAPIAELVLVPPGAVPKTSSGKVRRQACKQAYLDDRLHVIARSRGEDNNAEKNAEDQADLTATLLQAALKDLPAAQRAPLIRRFLLGKTAKLLAVPEEKLGSDMALASLGLDSLKAVALKHILDDLLGVSAPLTEFLSDRTLTELSELLAAQAPNKILQNETTAVSIVQPYNDALSATQQSIWAVHQQEADNISYNLHLALRLKGSLDIDRLRTRIERLMEVHTILRTGYRQDAEWIRQIVNALTDLHDYFQYVDAQDLTHAKLQEDLVRRSRQPFDLATGPVLRVTVYRHSERRHTLLFCAHHIALDLWSLLNLLQELSQAYQDFARSGTEIVTPSATEYADFVRWQRSYLASSASESAWLYWRQQLAGPLPILELPQDDPAVQETPYAGASYALWVSPNIVNKIKYLCNDTGATLCAFLLAAYQVLLHRYSQQNDIIVGVPGAGRPEGRFASVAGNFVNPLPIRTHIDPALSFTVFLEQVRDNLLHALEHQDFPFTELVDRLKPERVAGQWPVYQTWFVLQQAQAGFEPALAQLALGEDGPSIQLGEWVIEPLALKDRVENFDLKLMAAESDAGLLLSFQYRRERFKPETIARLAHHYEALLEQLANDTQRPLGDYELLTASEHRQILRDWNATGHDYKEHRFLPELIAAQAARTPDAIAVVFGDLSLSYRELDQGANGLAQALITQGAGPEVVVGICARRSLELVIGLLAILKSGAAYLPLDPDYPAERLTTIVEDAQPLCVLLQPQLQSVLPHESCKIIELNHMVINEPGTHDIEPFNRLHGAHPAYVLYTSGSTGKPKGVMVPHAGLRNRLLWMQEHFRLNASDTVLQKTPYSFDVSVWEFFWPLMTGARLIVAGPDDHKDPERLLALIVKHAVTTLHFVPSMLQAFLSAHDLDRCRSLKRVICSGEALSRDLCTRFHQNIAAELHNLYGPTEASIDVTAWHFQPHDARDAIPIGQPIFNTQIYLLDRRLNPVPIGVAGELYIGGMQLARGYLNRPDVTASAFMPHPFSDDPGTRIYKTGDLARYRNDGAIEYLGRLDHQVKIRGFRIELGEIEACLRHLPDIRDAAVMAREDTPGDKRLVAYVVTHKDTAPEADVLTTGLRAQLPEHCIPTAFVPLAELPLTVNGKLNRKALPVPDYRLQAAQYLGPRNDTEAQLAQIWADVLRLPRVGVDDNFFALGGDSILGIQAVSRARQAGLKFTPRQVFEHQTIATLARVAETVGNVSAVSDAEEPGGDVPLTPIQHWFFALDLNNPQHWNQSLWLETTRPLEIDRLQAALQQLVAHHDALRLRFVKEADGTWRQYLSNETSTTEVKFEDLSNLSNDEVQNALQRRADYWQTQFDILHGPMLRAVYFTLGNHAPARVLLLAHHLVIDAMSWRILIEDLDRSYRQAKDGTSNTLPAKSSSYQRWAGRLREHANKATYTDSVSELTPALPIDNPQGRKLEALAATQLETLDVALTQRLLQEASAAYRTTAQDLIVSALLRLVAQWTQQDVLRLDLETHGRDVPFSDIDLLRTVGWFTNIFPVRLQVPASSEIPELIKAVKEQIRAHTAKALDYTVSRWLKSDPNLVSNDRPSIVFNYLGQLDHAVNTSELFRFVHEPLAKMRDPGNTRAYEWEINAYIAADRLQIVWTYGSERYKQSTIRDLGCQLTEILTDLIEHCSSPGVGAYTPSDFPLATITQAQLDSFSNYWREIEDIYPLGPMQEGLLFHSLMHPGTGIYYMQDRYSLHGEIDPVIAQRAWQCVVDRHAILRSSFVWENIARPHQIVRRRVTLPFAYLDLRGLSKEKRAEHLESILTEERNAGFDLDHAPLMRIRLVRFTEDRWVLIRSHHHILLDAWCTSLILKDFLENYTALLEGINCPQIGRLQFRDYIAWLQTQDYEAARAFWKNYLAGFTAPTPLAIDKPGVDWQASDDVSDAIDLLSQADTQALNAAAQRHHLTVNTFAQAAWALCLSRYSSRREVLFGVTVAGRPTELDGIEDVLGLFINSLPLRIRLRPDMTGLDLLRDLLAHNSDLRQYEYLPLATIQQLSEIPRGQDLFASLFVFENTPIDPRLRKSAGPFQFEGVANRTHTNYPITVVVIPGARLHLQISYQKRRFGTDAIERLLGHFQQALVQLIHQSEKHLGNLAILPAEESQRLTSDWNKTARIFPGPADFLARFHAQVEQTPDTIAASCGEDQISYREINTQANRIANALIAHGIGPDDVVALLDERGIDLLVSILAIFKAGAAYLPLDPEHPPARWAQVLQTSSTRLVLTGAGLQAPLMNCLDGMKPAPPVLTATTLLAEEHPDQTPSPRGTPQNLAYVIYTSGSTGTPKGAMVERAGMLNNLLTKIPALDLAENDVIAQTAPQGFDISVWQFLTGLLCGARVQIIPSELVRDPQHLLQEITRHRVTVVEWVPSLIRAVLDLPEPKPDLPALRWLLPTGEALTPDLCRRWMTRYPHVQLLNAYGPAECADDVAYHRITAPPEPEVQRIPIGRPVDNLHLYVLDRDLNLVPTNVPGEICCAGIGLGRGYVRQSGLTAERFVPNPFPQEPGERIYKTGDLGRRLPDGNVEFLGRIDHQVKVRGFRVELGEIEAQLRRLSGVRNCAVSVREDSNGEKRLAAYVVLSKEIETAGINAESLRNQLCAVLPEYFVPSAFVFLDALPLSANGKLDRKSLPAPDFSEHLAEQYIAPRNPIETALTQIWTEVLRVQRVGVQDNFFALGGDSILSIQVVSRARQIGFSISPREVFQHQTVAALAETIAAVDLQETVEPEAYEEFSLAELDAERIAELRRAEPNIDDLYPLTPMQEGMLFHARLYPGTGMYLMQDRYRVQGHMDVAAFKQAWQDVVDHHAIFRTAFVWETGSRPHQAVHRQVPVNFEELDWRGHNETDQQRDLDALLDRELRTGFDLSQPGALRVRLIQLSDESFYFTRSYHHILMDAWCLSLLMVAVLRDYESLVRTGKSEMPQARPYRDYIAWHQRQDRDAAEQFWRNYLRGFTEPTPLVPERTETMRQHTGVADHLVYLAADDTHRLREESQRLQITANTFVQAAWALTIAHYSDRRDVVFGVTVAGRPAELAGCEDTIGLFINSLALRTQVNPAQRLSTWLKDLFENNLRLRQFDYSPLVEVQASSEIPRGEALFQSLLVYENAPIDPSLHADNLQFTILNAQDRVHTNYPLTVEILPEESLVLRLTYDTGLFDVDFAKAMLVHFHGLLQQMVRGPLQCIGELRLLTDAERYRQLHTWNKSESSLPQYHTVTELFGRQVARTPHSIAAESGTERWTYETLHHRANTIAQYLARQGMSPECVVAILAERSLDLLAMILGVFKAGAAYLPLDPSHPPTRLAETLALSRSPVVLVQTKTLGTAEQALADLGQAPNLLNIDELPFVHSNPIPCSIGENISQVCAPPNRLAYVIFTSGSTGVPKGAMVEQAGMLNNLLNKIPTLDLTSTDCIAQTASQCFDISVWQFLTALLCGARIRIVPDDIAHDPAALLREVETYGITVLESVPSLIGGMLDVAGAPSLQKLRWLLPTGETMPPEFCRRWLHRYPHTTLLNAYGPAECADDVAYHRIGTPPPKAMQSLPIGRPVPNTKLYILNKFLEPVPAGVSGELYVAGVGVGRGYLNDPGRTAQSFIPDFIYPQLEAAEGTGRRSSGSGRLYKTGDRARFLADGTIEYLDRIDHQVKLRGHRVELGEIEARLEAHEAVDKAVAIVREDQPGDQRLVAYVVLVNGWQAGERVEPLRRFLRESIPDYMVPSAFVFLDGLPLNANGKLNRRALPAPDWAGHAEQHYVVPRTDTELRVAAIWAQVLRLERVGVHDNFFDLGGHSLLATQIISRVQAAFDLDLPLRTLFEATTVAAMAEAMDVALWLRTQGAVTVNTDPALEDIEL